MNARELRERAVGLAAESRSLLIGGQLRDEGSGGTIESVDPTTGSIVASLPLGGEAEIDEAVRAARRALCAPVNSSEAPASAYATGGPARIIGSARA